MRRRLNAAVPHAPATDRSIGAAIRSKWALLGAGAIFLYVGSEVSIGSLMSNFLHQSEVLDISIESAGKLVSVYWLGAMVGRFGGSFLLTRIPAPRLLATAAGVAATLCLAVSQSSGMTAAVAALAIGLFNSIMFPVIFTMTLERSSASAEATSGLLCTAIVGGALLPPLAGKIADVANLHLSYLIPLAGYALITLFAMAAAKAAIAGTTVAATHH
jgi:FHS family L-fucose permease-like MFS transporter